MLCEQYLFLPLTLTGSFLGVLIGNSLYLVAAVAYIYVAFLGYLGTFAQVGWHVFCVRVVAGAFVCRPSTTQPRKEAECKDCLRGREARTSAKGWGHGRIPTLLQQLLSWPCHPLVRVPLAVLPFLHNTTRFLTPVVPVALLFLITVIFRVNIVAWALSISF